MREVFPGIYELRLTQDKKAEQGVSSINIFIIPGKEGVNDGRSLMIDAGFKTEECRRKLTEALRELDIVPEKLDVLLTHRHHDHCGLAAALSEMGATLFMNPEEERHPYDCLTYKLSKESLSAQKRVIRSAGITEELAPALWAHFMRVSRAAQENGEWVLAVIGFPYLPIHAGSCLRYGEFSFEAIALRGHTYGQLGLMEEEKRIFFTADQLIQGVTPIVATSYPDERLLEGFFDSLEYIKKRCREGWTVLPSHGERVASVADSVDRIVFSYLEKATLVREAVKASPAGRTARELSEEVYHIERLPENDGEFFTYKMMLTKTYSLLEYLYGLGFLEKESRDGILYWKIKE